MDSRKEHTVLMYSTAYNLWIFTWFVHFELPFRLKGTDKIHTKVLFKFHSNIYYILFGYMLIYRTYLSRFYWCLILFDLVWFCEIWLDQNCFGLIWIDLVWSGVIRCDHWSGFDLLYDLNCLKDDLSRIIIIYLEMCEYLNDTLKTSEDNKKSLLKKNYLLLNCC